MSKNLGKTEKVKILANKEAEKSKIYIHARYLW